LQDCKKRQGTTSVVPEDPQDIVGLQPLRRLFSAIAFSQRLKPESNWCHWRHDWSHALTHIAALQ
jgi:hypothetical protein